MKKTIDNFSKQSGIYKKFRPEYPQALYEVLLSHAKHRDACWDCGTGNGQVAKELAKYFKQVEATDISENQIKLAEKRPNINFQVARVEATPFKENQFDLITVAQAMHWFDFKAFNAEVKRVGKPGSSICIWGYDLLRIDKKVDPIIKTFYTDIVGPYWNKERKHVDLRYESIKFDFKEIPAPENLEIRLEWQLQELLGYLNSWSSVQNYLKENKKNPILNIEKQLRAIWRENEVKQVRFPIFMRIGIVEK